MKSQTLLLTGTHKTPNYFKPNEHMGHNGKGILCLHSAMFTVLVQLHTPTPKNGRAWQTCLYNKPTWTDFQDPKAPTSLEAEGHSTDFHIEGTKFCDIFLFTFAPQAICRQI